MITLRLFNVREPARQVEARALESGEISIGRDRSQDWVLDDPGRLLSRSHLVVTARNGAVLVTDKSANGVVWVDRDERLPQGRATPVPLGSTLRFGPFMLVIEHATAGAVADAAPRKASRGGGSPFDAFAEDAHDGLAPPPNPFASALPNDPLSAPPEFAHASAGAPLDAAAAQSAPALAEPASGDVWGRPPQRKAGDWDAPPPRRKGHDGLIGSAQSWREAAAATAKEVGFGFDAPFTQPMLRKVDVSSSDLTIPSDWDQPGAVRRLTDPQARDPGRAAPASREAPFVGADLPFPDAHLAPPPALDVTPVVHSTPPTGADPFAPATPARRSPAPAAPSDAEAALMNAFFKGAKLDPAVFAQADPAEVMERVGVIYRQMILGMSDLLGERTSLKNEYRMVRTTVRAENNNPFKWAPPQKVAAQLLLAREEGFLSGPDAVTGAFQDLKKHLLCMLAGLRAAIFSTLEALSPSHVEAQVKGQNLLMKNRGSAAWAEYNKSYADFCKQADDNPDSLINREFRSAYEQQLSELDSLTLR